MMGGGYPSWALPLRPSTELPHPIARACPEQPRDPLCFYILAHSFARFCTFQKLNSFLFKRFLTLCTKHPGWGITFRVRKTSPEGTAWARQAVYRQSPPVADTAGGAARALSLSSPSESRLPAARLPRAFP